MARSRNRFVIYGLLLGILLAAMDNTIVATAMGTILSDLGGFNELVWVISAYMVSFMAGTPIFGKLSDMYGRKRFFILGLVLFIIGSALCGTAQNMIQLSLYRAVQGIGGGAILPIAFTISIDIFPPEKRGKVFGLFGTAFGVASIIGPVLGALLTEAMNWRWIFYINLPLGIVSLGLILFAYHESYEHSRKPIDWFGALTLVGAVVSLMFALELGGSKFAWNSSLGPLLFLAFVILLIGFLYIEAKAAEPIISYAMFKDRLFLTSNIAAFFIGITFIATTIYIPIFVQGVLGGSVTNSGVILAPMMLGSVLGSQLGGFLTTKISYRSIMMGSISILFAGILLLGLLTSDTPNSVIIMDMILTGFGVGFSFSVLSMSAIHNIEMRQRGSATATNRFVNSLGTTLGITIFGIVQNGLFLNQQVKSHQELTAQTNSIGRLVSSLLTPEGRAGIPAGVLHQFSLLLATSIAHTFLFALIPAALAAISVLFMPNVRLVSQRSSGKLSVK